MQACTPFEPLPQLTKPPQEFLDFANEHYNQMQKAGERSNPYKLHRCCFTFSSKKLRPNLGHPIHEAVTFRQLVDHHDARSVEKFASLLFRLSTDRWDNRTGLVPTINQPHPKPIALGKRRPLLPPAEDLQARITELEVENKQLRRNLKAHDAEYEKMYSMINDLRMRLVLAKGQQHFNYYCFDYLHKSLSRPLSMPELNSIQTKARSKAIKEAELELRRHLEPYPSKEVQNMSHCPETLLLGQDLGCGACRATITLPQGEETGTLSDEDVFQQPEPKSVADNHSLTSKATLKQ